MSSNTIRETNTPDLPEDHEFREETFKEQVWRKARENPAVPIGESCSPSLSLSVVLEVPNDVMDTLSQVALPYFSHYIWPLVECANKRVLR
jgi:hypothetical protein